MAQVGWIFNPTQFWYGLIPIVLISLCVQIYLGKVFEKWSHIKNNTGLNGIQVGLQIFKCTTLQTVKIDGTSGSPNDYFDPKENIVHLSDQIATQPSIAAMAVTAHELGHAQQLQSGSRWITARYFLAPGLLFSPIAAYITIVIGVLWNLSGFLRIGILFFALMVIFSFLTLPMEINASRRALKLLNDAGLLTNETDRQGTRQLLIAAGMTYLSAAIGSIFQLLFFILIARQKFHSPGP